MIGEVNKLIYNALIKHGGLYLPDVGSLSILRYPAAISSRNEILPPHYGVEFRKESVGRSIVEIIAAEVGVELSRAEEIYGRWLEKSREGSVVTIDRVGVIRGEVFECDNTLIAVLNVNSHPLTIDNHHSRKPLWAMLTLLLVVGFGYGAWWYYDSQRSITDLVTIVAEETEITTDDIDIIAETEVVEPQHTEVAEVVGEIVEEVNTEAEPYDWRENENIRHWVVVGSYSTTDNAERAIADIIKRMPDAQCNYFKLGSMYAVAVFGSEELSECQEYKRAHIKEFSESWVYTPKRFR